MKTWFVFNSSLGYFTLINLLFLFSVFFDPIIIQPVDELWQAAFLHFLSTVFFVFGYLFFNVFYKYNDIFTEKKYYLTNSFKLSVIGFALLGLIVAIYQIIYSDSIESYFSQLLLSNENGGSVGLRDTYLKSHEDGGLSGAVKMFSTSSLAAYLATTGMLCFNSYSEKDSKALTKLNYFALSCLVLKTFLSLDRLSIFAIIISQLYLGVKNNKLFKLNKIIPFIIVLWVGEILTRTRYFGMSLFESVIFYFQMSLNNYGIVIKTLQGSALGFETVFQPFTFIFRFLGIDYQGPYTYYDWQENPAQYLGSYAYIDFGYFSLFFFFIYGLIYAKVDYMCFIKKSSQYHSFFFVTLYNLCLSFVIPPFRGIEFWLTICICIFIASRLNSVETYNFK